MPAGMPYFAWIDPGEEAFLPEHLRWDEQVFSFNLGQDEGDPASLSITVRRPRNEAGNPIGLLGPARKIWCWFALDCGPDTIRFRGRLVGVPTSLFDDLVTLEFVARPIDLVAQKEALAETLRVLPYYDEVVIDPARRTDPEVVLEGYTKVWHYDRETHELTVSDEITGEDGLVEFDGVSEGGKILYEGLGLNLTSGPLARVDVRAVYTWTQQAKGSVDLTRYIVSNWPGVHPANAITSYTLSADSWPKPGTGIGDGWEVSDSTAIKGFTNEVRTTTRTLSAETRYGAESFFGASVTKSTLTETQSFPDVGAGSIFFPKIVTNYSSTASSPDEAAKGSSSASYSLSTSAAVLPLNYIIPMLHAGYTANRQCTEVVTFSLFADVQHVLSDPEDGEALLIELNSVNLSETIGEGTDAYIPIGDPARRSYVATERGNDSIKHAIGVGVAHLNQRSRVVEIPFAPKLSRMPEITLRKNVYLVEPRIGVALGKAIGYSVALDGNDGRINCEVRIGCTIGKGGSTSAVAGSPTYCSIDYVGSDYQQFTGRIIPIFNSSVGYQQPAANPNDDGLEFLSTLTAADVIDVGLVVENAAQAQRDHINAAYIYLGPGMYGGPQVGLVGVTEEMAQEQVKARAESINNALKEVQTKATFKLKSMSRQFSTDYEIQVTDLKIATGYDLEAV